MRKAFFFAVFLASAAVARAQSTATLRGIDVYRSSGLTPAEARRRFEGRLRGYVAERNDGSPRALARAEETRRELEKEARDVPGVLWAQLHVTEYFTSVDHGMYAIFDVVDRSDAPRLAFAAAPKAAPPDPDGALAAWRAYVAEGEALSLRGEMPVDRPNCPGFYCLWGGTPSLDAAQGAFVDAAAKRGDALRRVLRTAADGRERAAALFVLSYSTSGPDVVSWCGEALADPDADVRGAALQILSDVTNYHQPELPIPMNRVLPRLDDPSFVVRGKAMGMLVPLAERPPYRAELLSEAPRLAELLKLSQPESSGLAFTLLGMLSKKSYDRRDYAAWDEWAAKAAAGKP